MKLTSAIPLVASAVALSACLPDFTQSEFGTPTASGNFTESNIDYLTIATADPLGNGYAYGVGVTEDDFFGIAYPVISVVAGVLPTTTVSDLPVSGTATFTGGYEAIMIDITQVNSGMTSDDVVNQFHTTDTITLTADFGAGSLTGNSGGLTVNGTFTSQDLGGTVDYNGLSGELTGLIGGDSAVGAFQGDDMDEILVGGFIVYQ